MVEHFFFSLYTVQKGILRFSSNIYKLCIHKILLVDTKTYAQLALYVYECVVYTRAPLTECKRCYLSSISCFRNISYFITTLRIFFPAQKISFLFFYIPHTSIYLVYIYKRSIIHMCFVCSCNFYVYFTHTFTYVMRC